MRISSHDVPSTNEFETAPFSPRAVVGPAIELPFPVPAPSSFIPYPSSFSDRLSQHHYDLALAEIDRLQSRIDELKMCLTGLGHAAVREGGV